ncbi:hypothetical protein KP806_26120 [Paenibacillus sp. N4]|uniref:putative amidoligase domain-containing protein n=1 Tax=Paenibacillus vietnamensis TaxID=2590547 RepID=UPI001CD0DE94|nr:hypothetical protein [Paenibacillus vietnamensis]MCA0758539.1 hypothetical protein [Paenibacillus vietnamensis]
MASTWIWRGSYDRLEEVSEAPAPGEGDALPPVIRPWTAVKPGDAVLAWTARRAIDSGRLEGAWILNGGCSTAARMPAEEKRRIWRRAGLCGGPPLDSERVFRVSVVHLEPLEIVREVVAAGKAAGERLRRTEGLGSGIGFVNESGYEVRSGAEWADPSLGGRKRQPGAGGGRLPLQAIEGETGYWPVDPAMRRVARTAVQALYALGLDIGEAVVALGGDGRTAVRDARPGLADATLAAAGLRRFAAWHAAESAAVKDRQLLIGADPEFVLVTPSGKVAAASRFFGAGAGGAAGADAVLVGRRLLYPVAELRPEPAADPAALAANVRRLLLRAAGKIGDPALRWAAGAMPVPGLALGGHIHVSGAPLTSRLLRLLDSYAAFPLALVEDPAGRSRRPRYGKLGDFRRQPHGGFEYRTLPSWLVSPLAAKAAFAIALLCAREAAALPYIPALDERYAAAYYAGDRTELAGCLDGVASAMAATASYAELAPYIEPLLEAARRGSVWDESADIRVKWRIPLR